ncbi:VIT1/CCC1 transporter family protein [Streptomyces sp. NPDC001978]|uniref:VIT1/CCC1 transporter family protein n=1 Tax=Streptomyces sp. NPDC001978 TaxID=3364627 RepID=UPI0036C87B2B
MYDTTAPASTLSPPRSRQANPKITVPARFRELDSAIGRHPDTRLKLAAAIDQGTAEATRQSPVVQSLWMFVTDLFAAAVPVLPFAFFALATARVVSLSVTLVLLVGLGIGRSVIGRRRALPTVIETVCIAAAATAAGLAVGTLIS